MALRFVHQIELYEAVVLDAFSRKIVGWAMETHLRTELVLAALNMALGQRRPAEVIHHHSDQGSRCGFKRSSMGPVGELFRQRHVRGFLCHPRVRAA